MRVRLSVWRTASLVLLAYQVLTAAATSAFAIWLMLAPLSCRQQPSCGFVGLIVVLGMVWLGQALIAGVVAAVLFVLTLKNASRWPVIATIVLQLIGLLVAARFLELIHQFGVPPLGLYAFGVAVAAAVVIVGLSVLELLLSDRLLAPHRWPAVALLVAIPFAAPAVPYLTTAYLSAQIGPDGFPVGPVTAQFVEARGSKLPLQYPGSTVRSSTATAESKEMNRYRIASYRDLLGKNALAADVQAWYRQSFGADGWHEIVCQQSGQCPTAATTVFVRGSRECVAILVAGDGVGDISVDYQILPSAMPLTGSPTTEVRYCTGQY